MSRDRAFVLPGWVASIEPKAEHRIELDYDLAMDRLVQDLRDAIITESLGILTSRLDCVHIAHDRCTSALDAALGQLDRTRVPASRAHMHWHLCRAVKSLSAAGGSADPASALRLIEAAWSNLSVAAREGRHALVDLSQCCCGLGRPSHHQEPRHAL